ncbi:amino acid ABC transporter permease [Wansuia hejianensis]|uniref:Amino acid ABC transporter permease n=1 Tax=Wansuia hejianensis TaxID=2763667 RepID=A0A7G9GE93_9FIRM|nr:amino acid ABC transporter permease [Wansuia hejianensis]QNM09125.1 amino acid ABC transporter permease [Wansuia hejianensis]
MYIVNGLKNTLIITVFAALLGIALGFVLAIIRSSHDKSDKPGIVLRILNFIAKVYLTVIRGTPVLVQVMIWYFGVFTSPNTVKIMVIILAFGINSGAYVAETVRSGIMSLDIGQTEAGRSLGLNFFQTMTNIIMPQAFKNVLPALGNEFITLLKETSICGYVGMMDLTKAGDIIRSQTYDQMMPLLGVAVIYLVIVMILVWLLGKLERRLRSGERRS